jgi:hypothetical protein
MDRKEVEYMMLVVLTAFLGFHIYSEMDAVGGL